MRTVVAVTLSSLLVVPCAFAQQSKDQQKCTNALSKDGAKLVGVQLKETLGCQKGFSAGKNGSAAACIAADAKGKVAKAAGKTLASEAGKCGSAPDFAAGSAGADATVVNGGATVAAQELLASIYGGDIDTATIASTDKAGAGCQQAVVKAMQKCVDTRLKTFNGCKKGGLGGKTPPGLIADAQSLEDSCFQAVLDDSKGKIASACAGVAGKGIDGAVAKKCVGKGVSDAALDAAFPCAASPVAAADLDRISRCEVCQYLDAADALARDCDLFDDGLANGTCPRCSDAGGVVSGALPPGGCVPEETVVDELATVTICPADASPPPCSVGAGCGFTLAYDSLAVDPGAGTADIAGSVDASGFVVRIDVGLGEFECVADPVTADFDAAVTFTTAGAACGLTTIASIDDVAVSSDNVTFTISGDPLCVVDPTLVGDLVAELVELEVTDTLTAALGAGSVGPAICPGP